MELTWDGKYDDSGNRTTQPRISLPFQTVETVNASVQQRQLAFNMSGSQRSGEWRNRLIWGDKKYVLPSLLGEFAGAVDLIYIDPPFATGADFSFRVKIEDQEFTKEPSIIEQKAYRDTWGQGADSYVRWFHDTCLLLRELLSETGSIYVHCDWHMSAPIRLILDEVFGRSNFQNEIMWCYSIGGKSKARFARKHDNIFLYSKSSLYTFNPKDKDVVTSRKPNSHMKVRSDPDGRQYQEKTDKKTGKVYRYYLDEGKTPEDYWTDIEQLNREDRERVGYDTQKPEALLRRIIAASSNPDDLVLDCFCGSGTTAAVAEKLGRRWITCDLGRFAIHTARKRLLNVDSVKPFVIQNLGKYERQVWQAAEFGGEEHASSRILDYRHFILQLFNAYPVQGYAWLHGIKNGRMVHVGAVDSPVSATDIKQISDEFRKAAGGGADTPGKRAIDVLGWDFAFELNEVAKQQAAEAEIDMRLLRIPREVLEEKAVLQGDIKFFELAALAIEKSQEGTRVTLALTDFIIPPDDVPADIQSAITHWSQWIDYWAVDWDNKDDTFHNMWQTYRSQKDRSLDLETAYRYPRSGEYLVMVKVIDILGNDTTRTLRIKIDKDGA